MIEKKKKRIALHIIFVAVCLIICYIAAFPFNLVPKFLPFSLTPVTEQSYVPPLKPGDLAVSVKKNDLSAGNIVKYEYHFLSSYAPSGPVFGHLNETEGQSSTYLGYYSVAVNINGNTINLISSKPQYVRYKISHLGQIILNMNANRYIVFAVCAAIIVVFYAIFFATAKKRELKRRRTFYISAFEKYGSEYEDSSSDY